jgi:hypothetical protein
MARGYCEKDNTEGNVIQELELLSWMRSYLTGIDHVSGQQESFLSGPRSSSRPSRTRSGVELAWAALLITASRQLHFRRIYASLLPYGALCADVRHAI